MYCKDAVAVCIPGTRTYPVLDFVEIQNFPGIENLPGIQNFQGKGVFRQLEYSLAGSKSN